MGGWLSNHACDVRERARGGQPRGWPGSQVLELRLAERESAVCGRQGREDKPRSKRKVSAGRGWFCRGARTVPPSGGAQPGAGGAQNPTRTHTHICTRAHTQTDFKTLETKIVAFWERAPCSSSPGDQPVPPPAPRPTFPQDSQDSSALGRVPPGPAHTSRPWTLYLVLLCLGGGYLLPPHSKASRAECHSPRTCLHTWSRQVITYRLPKANG